MRNNNFVRFFIVNMFLFVSTGICLSQVQSAYWSDTSTIGYGSEESECWAGHSYNINRNNNGQIFADASSEGKTNIQYIYIVESFVRVTVNGASLTDTDYSANYSGGIIYANKYKPISTGDSFSVYCSSYFEHEESDTWHPVHSWSGTCPQL